MNLRRWGGRIASHEKHRRRTVNYKINTPHPPSNIFNTLQIINSITAGCPSFTVAAATERMGVMGAHATTCNRTPSCSCKQAMMLNRFAAVGLPLGPNI